MLSFVSFFVPRFVAFSPFRMDKYLTKARKEDLPAHLDAVAQELREHRLSGQVPPKRTKPSPGSHCASAPVVNVSQMEQQRREKIAATQQWRAELKKELVGEGMTRKEVEEGVALAMAQQRAQDNPGRDAKLTPPEKEQVKKFITENPKAGPTAVLTHFQYTYPSMFKRMVDVSTIERWRRKLLRPETLPQHAARAVGRPKIIPRPLLEWLIEEVREMIRNCSPMSWQIFRGIVLAEIMSEDAAGQPRHPALLISWQAGEFQVSPSWCRKTLNQYWIAWRRIGGKGGPESPDAAKAPRDFLLRLAFLIAEHNIPKWRVFGWDQTGIPALFLPSHTRAVEGARHVKVQGADDKRQVTATPFHNWPDPENRDHQFFVLQILFEGLTARCLPDGWQDYEAEGIRPRHTATHWSSVLVQQDLLKDLESFLCKEAERQAGDEIDKMKPLYLALTFILIIDCYCTHICCEFLRWFKNRYNGTNHPKGFVIFVPAGHTGDIQVCDLVVQKRLKQTFQEQGAFHVARCVRAGKSLDVRLATLKPKVLDWALPAMKFFRSLSGVEELLKGFLKGGYAQCFDPDFQAEARSKREELFPACGAKPSVKRKASKQKSKPKSAPKPRQAASSTPPAKAAPRGPLDSFFAPRAPGPSDATPAAAAASSPDQSDEPTGLVDDSSSDTSVEAEVQEHEGDECDALSAILAEESEALKRNPSASMLFCRVCQRSVKETNAKAVCWMCSHWTCAEHISQRPEDEWMCSACASAECV